MPTDTPRAQLGLGSSRAPDGQATGGGGNCRLKGWVGFPLWRVDAPQRSSSRICTSFTDMNVRGSGPDGLCRHYGSDLGVCGEHGAGDHAEGFSVPAPRVSKGFVREQIVGLLEWTVDPIGSTGQALLESREHKGGFCHSACCGYYRRIRPV